ncbi:MAG: carboxypeptidase M32 [Pseudomonadota bacterium]
MAVTPYKQLEQEWQRLHAFRGALSLLRWDAAVMMPRGSSDVRGEQLAAIETEQHALLTSPRVSRLLERAVAGSASLDDWQRANLREMSRQRDHAIATPVSLISRLARATSLAEVRWSEAREKNDFNIFAPHLEEVLHLVRDRAALLGQALNLAPYDALLDGFTPGLRMAELDSMFKALSRRLPSLIREAIELQSARPPQSVSGRFASGKQRQLIVEVMKAIGFPFDRGRVDESDHPFTEGVAGDIRVTTKLDNADPFTGLLAAIHETGHALHDLGVPGEWRTQPVGSGLGVALEEAQSLLFEMIVCRRRAFLVWLRPLLEKHFSVSGPEWEADNLYRLLNRVRRSAIRVDADELTYPLHVMVRYGIEKDLLDGRLAARDLPAVWNQAMADRLEVAPANDVEGCLQDIHWALGLFGYFPSYAAGGVIAAQLFENLRAHTPDLDEQLARGDFTGVTGWLSTHVHAYGARLTLQELMKQATGKPLGATAALRYLESKYLEAEPTTP